MPSVVFALADRLAAAMGLEFRSVGNGARTWFDANGKQMFHNPTWDDPQSPPFPLSVDICEAHLIPHMEKKGFWLSVEGKRPGAHPDSWSALFDSAWVHKPSGEPVHGFAFAPTLAEAICRAALHVLEGDPESEWTEHVE